MELERQERRTQQIPLTPLIDVVFLLIVFFMLSTNFVMSESLELSLPSGQKKVTNPDDVLRILITNDNRLRVGDSFMGYGELDAFLFDTVAEDPDTKILILSAEKVNVQQLVKVMDIVYLSGGRNVQIDDWQQEKR
ncbi:MAG: hypothetical protein CMM94_01215 [Rickettsiales bacterium]|nr:hypothetical protein [Rickettsiales bacterium]|tara:strand:+ start:253 stop:660 length:408 start_codon:yes stop_codon:yes gene_type:complete